MSYPITQNQLEAFRTDGALMLRGLIDAPTLDALRRAVDDDMREPGPFYHGYESDEGRFHGNLRLWETHATFRAFCLSEFNARVAQTLLGAQKINLLYDQLFVKEQAMSQRTRWHNDQPYWPISGRQVISLWIALDPTTAENGRLEFIRGSHRWERWFQPEAFGKTDDNLAYERNPDYEIIPDIESARARYDIITWDLEPGDAYVFHGMTVHGAGGNSSGERMRRGYTVRYVGDDVRYDPRIGVSQPLLCETLAAGDVLDSPRYPVVLGG
ncbi:MAG: phytanoyl-CoA dioxygenase family protein [Pseudomonadota bacterium]